MGYESLTPEEFESKLKEDNSIVLVDVRSNDEHNQGHIPNSIVIPVDTIDSSVVDKLDKNKKIFLYCRSGMRSAAAAEKLVNLGYANVSVLDGGLNNWKYGLE